MNNTLLKISLAALSLGALPAAAQTAGGTKFGLKAGVSMATLSGLINADSKFRPGFVAGPMLRLAPSKQHFIIQVEALLSGQGANATLLNGTEENYRLSYLNVPVLLRQYIGGIFYVNVGPQLGLQLGSNKGAYKAIEGGVTGGFGVELPGGLVADLRLNYGLTDINDDAAERSFRRQLGLGGLHNRVFQGSIGYLFGKK